MHPAAPLDGSDSSKRQGTESSEALLISQAASCLAVAFGKKLPSPGANSEHVTARALCTAWQPRRSEWLNRFFPFPCLGKISFCRSIVLKAFLLPCCHLLFARSRVLPWHSVAWSLPAWMAWRGPCVCGEALQVWLWGSSGHYPCHGIAPGGGDGFRVAVLSLFLQGVEMMGAGGTRRGVPKPQRCGTEVHSSVGRTGCSQSSFSTLIFL